MTDKLHVRIGGMRPTVVRIEKRSKVFLKEAFSGWRREKILRVNDIKLIKCKFVFHSGEPEGKVWRNYFWSWKNKMIVYFKVEFCSRVNKLLPKGLII